ncbi:MAG TPA: mechanosensitive ion channel domain-containing protein [Chloroflexota bacterium]|nr:mechanosensitive ion channel domain-containing protein [Chloroflexota bacterium]
MRPLIARLEDALTNHASPSFRATTRATTALVMLSIALIAAEGVEELHTHYRGLLDALDHFVLVAFTVEYLANVLVSRPRWKYSISFFGVIDLLAILPFYLASLNIAGLLLLRELRVIRVVRVLKLMKASSASRDDSDEVWVPLAVFVSLAGTAWILDDFLSRSGIGDFGAIRQVVGYATQVAVVFSGAYFANRLTQILVWDGFVRQRLGESVPRLIRDVYALVVYSAAAIFTVSTVFHQSLAGVLAATGALSVVIGLALRNVILDLFMGLAMQIDRPFKIGDFVMLQGTGMVGRVTEIHWRTTRLQTNENNSIVIPNNRIGDMVIVNFSDPSSSAEFELTFTLDRDVLPERVLHVLTEAALAVANTGAILSDPEPKARIKDSSPMGIEYKLKYWIDCTTIGPGKARHLVLASVFEHLFLAGLKVAQPKQELTHVPPVALPSGGALVARPRQRRTRRPLTGRPVRIVR